jgi:hypothetical protein
VLNLAAEAFRDTVYSSGDHIHVSLNCISLGLFEEPVVDYIRETCKVLSYGALDTRDFIAAGWRMETSTFGANCPPKVIFTRLN